MRTSRCVIKSFCALYFMNGGRCVKDSRNVGRWRSGWICEIEGEEEKEGTGGGQRGGGKEGGEPDTVLRGIVEDYIRVEKDQ